MRQAGRYLEQYRQTREAAGSFLNLCKTPQLACEVSLQPVEIFPELDGVIIFSDILTIPDAMGMGLELVEGYGPRFKRPLQQIKDIDNLALPDVEVDLAYVGQALELTKQKMNPAKTLIGFCGSPWTIACYMLSNDKESRINHAVSFANQNRQAMEKLLSILSVACADYLALQVASGAEVIQIFDTWGGALDEKWPELSFHWIKKTISSMQDNLKTMNHPTPPTMLYTRADEQYFDLVANSSLVGLSVPADRSLGRLRQRYSGHLILQGNLDQSVLEGDSESSVCQATEAVLADYGEYPGHIFNLGHGITPKAKVENVAAMVKTVAQHRH